MRAVREREIVTGYQTGVEGRWPQRIRRQKEDRQPLWREQCKRIYLLRENAKVKTGLPDRNRTAE